ncbi:MAG: TauD/TfdA family dioxygenase [Proteobacteria bacterium]|nr:TauD/TfdA family dioxygenase [Pseudomonadota bacterium]
MFTQQNVEPFGVLLEASDKKLHIRDIDVGQLKELFHEHQLVVLRGFLDFSTSEEFAQYCESWGPISIWPFGKVLEVVEHANPTDHIFDHSYVPLHWDGMYRPEVAEYQIFHCVKSPLGHQGGRTTFSNTRKILEHASQSDLTLWKRVTGEYERKMEFYHSKIVAPVIAKHPTKNYEVIRYCEPTKESSEHFLNHPEIQFQGINVEESDQFKTSLAKALYSPKNLYAHQWQAGDLVIADNHTLLHGRESFTTKASRHLRRVHVLGERSSKNPHLVFHQ